MRKKLAVVCLMQVGMICSEKQKSLIVDPQLTESGRFSTFCYAHWYPLTALTTSFFLENPCMLTWNTHDFWCSSSISDVTQCIYIQAWQQCSPLSELHLWCHLQHLCHSLSADITQTQWSLRISAWAGQATSSKLDIWDAHLPNLTFPGNTSWWGPPLRYQQDQTKHESTVWPISA